VARLANNAEVIERAGHPSAGLLDVQRQGPRQGTPRQAAMGYAFDAPLAVSPDARGKRELRAANPALGLVAAAAGRVETIDEERREVTLRDGSNSRFAAYSVLDNADLPSTQCPTLGEGGVVATLLIRLSPSGYWREPARRTSYADALSSASGARPDALKGKIALIGVTLDHAGDRHPVIRGWKNEELYGVELHAETIANLARGIAVRPLGPTVQWLLMLALACAGAAASFLLFDRPPRQRGIALGLAFLAYAAAGVACYLAFDILLNTLYDIAAFALAYAWLFRLQRKALAEPLEEVSP
jgi:CHASE2 domain-containing sensor protein